MKKNLWIVALILLAVPTSCNLSFLSNPLEKTWRITKIELADTDEESETLYLDAFISFYPEGAASFFDKNEDQYESGEKPLFRLGKWAEADGTLTVSLKQTSIDVTFNIIENSDKWLVLEIADGPEETIGTVLKCQVSDLYRSASYDVLDPRNNAWRDRPVSHENKDALKIRVLQHVDYLLAYFKMIDDKDQDHFETAILGTPFRFYANGVALPNGFETDSPWLSNFYNEDNAAVGGEILSRGLGSIGKYPADDKSYTKGYFNTMQLIKEYIEK